MHRAVRSSRSTDAVSTQMSGGFNPGANSFNPNAGSFIPGGAPAFVPGQPYGGPAAYGAQQGQQQQQQQGGNPADYYNQYAGAPYGAPGAGYGACVRSVENSCPRGRTDPLSHMQVDNTAMPRSRATVRRQLVTARTTLSPLATTTTTTAEEDPEATSSRRRSSRRLAFMSRPSGPASSAPRWTRRPSQRASL